MTLNDIIGWTLVALVLAPIGIGCTLRAPKLVLMPMLALIIMFSASTWGQFDSENTLYSRGTGLFYFSVLNLALFVVGFGLLVKRLAYPRQQDVSPAISMIVIGLTVVMAGNLIVGIAMNVDIPVILGYGGIINVFNMLIFMYLVIASIRTRKDQKDLITMIIALAAVRAVFGLVRYHWFGGDTANPYRNFEGMDIKLVYFDVGDGFIASLGAFWASWMLTTKEIRLSFMKRIGLYSLLALEVATVVLSFRRSSLIGLILMFVFLLFRLSGMQRAKFLLVAVGITIMAGTVFFQDRLQFASKHHGGILDSMIYDIKPNKDGESTNRLYELYAAARSVDGNWLTGIGTWGVIHGDETILSYHMGRFDFIHSGFGHVILKTGLIGLALFLGIFIAFFSHYLNYCRYLKGNPRLLADAGIAGFLYWFPTLLIGTPIIEFRTMLFLGLTLALPFIAAQAHHRSLHSYAIA